MTNCKEFKIDYLFRCSFQGDCKKWYQDSFEVDLSGRIIRTKFETPASIRVSRKHRRRAQQK